MSDLKVILGQDKNYEGKLGKRDMEEIVGKFKKAIRERTYDKRGIGGFEINGGDGLTRGGQEVYDTFQKEQQKLGRDVEYNTRNEMLKIRDTLRNKNKNVHKI